MLDNIKSKIVNLKNKRETIRELQKLSNRELEDIGIARYDIPTIAKKLS